jgi:uncharacterized membrane protein required for colicin V production
VDGAVTWTIDQYVIVGTALVAFGFIGLQRGVHRELHSMVGIGIGALLSGWLARTLAPQINRLYRLGRYALEVGLSGEDPGVAWRRIGATPDLVQATENVSSASVVVFCLIVLVAFMWGQRRVAAPHAFLPRLLGMLAGALNGFLVCYYLVPLVFPTPRAIIAVQSGGIRNVLTGGQTPALVAVSLVAILIAFGLHSASGPGPERRQ